MVFGFFMEDPGWERNDLSRRLWDYLTVRSASYKVRNPQSILIRCLDLLSCFYQCKAAVAVLPPNVRAPHPASKGWAQGAYFDSFYPQPHPFGHYAELKNITESWNVDRAVNWGLRVLAHVYLYHNVLITADAVLQLPRMGQQLSHNPKRAINYLI